MKDEPRETRSAGLSASEKMTTKRAASPGRWAALLGICALLQYQTCAQAAAYKQHASQSARKAKLNSKIRLQKIHVPPSTAKGVAGIVAASNSEATRATVTLSHGVLMIAANNSELTQILEDVAKLGGTTIRGPIKVARVYGAYGPRSPRDVLTDLLEGLGYNFIMVGVTAQGAPQQLVLTLATGAGPQDKATSPPAPSVTPSEATEADIPDEEQPGPGGVLHVPPPPPEDLHERVEQNLQRLQQMQNQLNQPEPPQ